MSDPDDPLNSRPGPLEWHFPISESDSWRQRVRLPIPKKCRHIPNTWQTRSRHFPDTFQAFSKATLQTRSAKLPVSPHIPYHPDTNHSQILNFDQGRLHGSYSLRKDMPQASGTLPAIRTHCRYTSDTLQTHFFKFDPNIPTASSSDTKQTQIFKT
jgi:hypothetical protein